MSVQVSVEDYRKATDASFNTSYVSVQGYCFSKKKDLYLSFNTSYVSVQDLEANITQCESKMFQYILCVGSSCCGAE